MTDDERFMRVALEVGLRGVAFGQSPFGACVAADGQVVAAAHNRVWATNDPTAHAEVCAIREACEARGAIRLSDCTLYATTEPCPMCFGAIHWARIERIVYAATIQDACDFGFNELPITAAKMKELGGAKLLLAGGVLREEGLDLFRTWARRKEPRAH